MVDNCELEKIAQRLRRRVIQMSHDAHAPHLGSSLSCIDILVAAYWTAMQIDPHQPNDPQRDRLILSKGHASAALYATLAERGFFPSQLLAEYCQAGSSLAEQMAPNCVAGVEAATGSLGHGLSLGVGIALAGRIQKQQFNVWVVLSDGECNEGSVWEAAMMASAQKLGNLAVVVDYNGWQATGRSDDVLAISPLKEKWQAFGFDTCEIDGHNFSSLTSAMADLKMKTDQPSAIIAKTIKGRGVSFMEDDNNWHYRIPNDEELQLALKELGAS